MLFAFTSEESGRVRAEKGLKGFCPDCSAEMVPKCGQIMTPHWAHKTLRDCDTWSEGETEWHRGWKGEFPDDEIEVRLNKDGKRHIADVKLASPIGKIEVIEFQHSSISPEEIEARERFYGKNEMLWMFDAIQAYKSRRFWFEDANKSIDGKKIKTTDWKHGKKSLLACDATVVLDLGKAEPTERNPLPEHWLFRVISMGTYWKESEWDGQTSTSERMVLTGYFRTREKFLRTFSVKHRNNGNVHT